MARPVKNAMTALIVVLGAAGAGAQPQMQTVPDKRIVDCLLPGQVKMLGKRTYLTPRRPARLPAIDCAIRGGEMLVFDRASFSSSLAHWLSLAKEGNVEAQIYVGEIFERGLGREPDYKLAAQWYQQAADKGNPAALISLAQLYEKGLGVARDMEKAQQLYARAYGTDSVALDPETVDVTALQGEPVVAVAPPDSQQRRTEEEMQRLRQSLDELEKENQRLLEHSELSETYRSQVTSLEAALEESRRQLQEMQAQQQAQQNQQEAQQNQQQAQQEQQQAQQDQAAAERLAAMQGEISRLEAEAARYRSQLEKIASAAEMATSLAEPRIEIINPTVLPTRSAEQDVPVATRGAQNLIGRVYTQSGLQSLQVNGRKVRFDDEYLFETIVPLQENRVPVAIEAVDDQGRLSRRVINLVLGGSVPVDPGQSIPKARYGKFYALLVGNETYSHLPSLSTAIDDVSALGRVLRDRYGFDVKVIENGSRETIMDAMYELLGKLKENDNLLMYYAGHGTYVPDTGRGHWLPVDARPNSQANWISNVEISDYLKQMKAKHILVISDSCYSGAMTRSALIDLDGDLSEREWESRVRKMAETRARVVITSGGLAPVYDQPDPDSPYSLFAGPLIEILEANQGLLSAQALGRTVSAKVSHLARSYKLRQQPQYAPLKHTNHGGGDFFFVPSG